MNAISALIFVVFIGGAALSYAAHVPLIVPILLSLIFGFWGWLLAAPLLAVIFAYRAYARSRVEPSVPRQTPPGQVITGGRLISPGESTGHIPRQDETL